MSAVWTWIRLDLRSRARSLVVLALLVAVTTGVVLTATAGARRGSTAVDRLVERTRPATVAALPNAGADFDWDAVAALPGVETVARFAVSGFTVDGLPEQAVNFPYADGTMRDIERPVVLEGRLADPARDDEAVVTAGLVRSTGQQVGDVVTVRLFSPEQVDGELTGEDIGDPAGPVIETTIVGVVRSPWFSDSGTEAGGTFIASTGLFDQHEANLVGAQRQVSVNALVRLEDGAAGVPRFREQLAEVSGRRDIEFFDLAAAGAHLRDVARFEARALLAFAAAALVAAMLLVGQAIVRFVAAAADDLRVLAAVGMPPGQVRAAAAAGPVVAAAVGAPVGVLSAYLLSGRFPSGTTAPFEPSPGRRVDVAVLLGGGLALVVLVGLGALLASVLATRGRRSPVGARRSTVAGLVARAGAPVPVTVGAGFALDRGRGAQAVPVYPALVGAVVGVLGVVAALTFADGVADATSHPERFGQVSDLQVFAGFNGEDFLPVEDGLAIAAADEEVRSVNDTRQGVLESGPVDLAAFELAPVDEPLPIVLLEGHLPATTDEVTLATETAERLGAEVGDRIELTGSRSSGSYRVSGLAFVLENSHNEYDAGAWVRSDTFDELIDGFKFHTIEIALTPGADPQEVASRLGVALADGLGFPPEAAAEAVTPRTPPSRLSELREIRRLPTLLAGFLALLAIGAVGHALASAVRRRRHDLAVLRAVGVTRGQSRATVLVQATLLALVGVSLGVPLGFALGRTLWESVASTTPIQYVPPLAVWVLVLAAPVALLVANLLAAWPSHRAASLRVSHVLRTE